MTKPEVEALCREYYSWLKNNQHLKGLPPSDPRVAPGVELVAKCANGIREYDREFGLTFDALTEALDPATRLMLGAAILTGIERIAQGDWP